MNLDLNTDNKKSKVSVIVPCYNSERFISRCLNSIYKQTYTDIQLIIINDGSTDNTSCIVSEWIAKMNTVGITAVYLYQENRGAGSAVNKGLKYVKGEYLTLLDSDDMFLPDSVRLRAEYLDSHPDCGVVVSDGYEVAEGDTEAEEKRFSAGKTPQAENLFDELINANMYNWAGSYMVRTDILWKTYPDRNIYPSRYGQNLQILLPVAYLSKAAYIDIPLMKYILQPQSLSRIGSAHDRMEKLENNYLGYLDIRVHMINLLVQSASKRDEYLRDVGMRCYRTLMELYGAEDIRKTEEYYRKMRKLGNISSSDRKQFYLYRYPVLKGAVGIWKKLKNRF